MALALRKCPDLVCVPGDFALYQRCSRAFKEICASYAPAMESFSIDEVFLDMTGTHLIYPDPVAVAHEIKDKIRDELGFTVNVGIGTNKLLAKMASDFEKPDKVHTLFPPEIPKKMWPLPVRDLLFLGKASEQRLLQEGIKTIGDMGSGAGKLSLSGSWEKRPGISFTGMPTASMIPRCVRSGRKRRATARRRPWKRIL